MAGNSPSVFSLCWMKIFSGFFGGPGYPRFDFLFRITLLAFGLMWCQQSKDGFKQIQCTVLEISDRRGGGIIGNDSWTVKVKLPGGSTLYGTVYSPVIVNQRIYTTQWLEDGTTYYSTGFSTHKQNYMFEEKNEKE